VTVARIEPACLDSARESTIAKSGSNSTRNFPNHRIGYSAAPFALVDQDITRSA